LALLITRKATNPTIAKAETTRMAAFIAASNDWLLIWIDESKSFWATASPAVNLTSDWSPSLLAITYWFYSNLATASLAAAAICSRTDLAWVE